MVAADLAKFVERNVISSMTATLVASGFFGLDEAGLDDALNMALAIYAKTKSLTS